MTVMKNPIIVLTGPTASGKTAMAHDIAKRFNCEIICTDSMTVYRGMDIGTDKPTLEITDPTKRVKNSDGAYIIHGIPHHLLDIVNPDEEFNVSIFQEKVTKIIHEIQNRGHVPLLVGGSVMYIDALVFNYELPPVAPDPGLRKQLEELSTEELFEKLCNLDPDCQWTIDRHNRRRVIRALEVWLKTERPFSEQKSKSPLPENILYLAVDREREDLYNRIDTRVDQMFREGLIEEVKALDEKYDGETAMQAAGYKQIREFLNGETSLEDAASRTKQAHRNYAKRQLTWLRRNPDVKWVTSTNEAEKYISKFLEA
jgi:tRNA dimethylallyltransferase